MRTFLHRVALGVVLFIGSTSVYANHSGDAPAGTWQPMSKTAIAITGPIAFVNGKLYVDGVHRFNYTDTAFGYALVSTKEANPTLLNGNSLCGKDTVPTHMTLITRRDNLNDTLQMDIYATNRDKPPALCGQFYYVRDK